MKQQVDFCTVSHTENNERLVAVKGVLRQKERVLLVQRAQTDTLGGMFEFPGGGVEAGENLFNALRREFLEEVGFKNLENIHYFSCIDIPSKKIHLVFYFVCSDEVPSLLEDQADLIWVDELPRHLSLTPETKKILRQVFAA